MHDCDVGTMLIGDARKATLNRIASNERQAR